MCGNEEANLEEKSLVRGRLVTIIKMKGLLKGLRYISQIFEEEEEKEMQIGYPTEVKHVAHFGCDGPSANSPSWMGEYQFTSGKCSGKGIEPPTKEIKRLSIDSSTRQPLPKSPAKRPHRRRSSAPDSPSNVDLSGRDKHSSSSSSHRHSRRPQSVGPSSSAGESPAIDETFRRSRRQSKLSTVGSDSPAGDALSAPKQSRRRKSKGESNPAASVAVGIP